jgi:Domain of unknown function (DUF2357)/PD-(D/E)XK nuclease superfamily
MEIISYSTVDFKLIVHSNHIDQLYKKAESHIKNIHASTHYRFAETSGYLELWMPVMKTLTIVLDTENLNPVFFENENYHFEIAFSQEVKRFHIHSRLSDISDKFTNRQRNKEQTFSGTINFGNDIGAFELAMSYEKSGISKSFRFQFEVFSTKLDFKNDHKILVQEVEDEYSKLSLDLLKKTYFGFKSKPGDGNDLTWWFIFAVIFRDLAVSMRFVLDRPLSRLIRSETLHKGDQLKRLTPRLEEELVRYRSEPARLYRVANKVLSHDTIENRFLKHVAVYTYRKFTEILPYLLEDKKSTVSEGYRQELEETGQQLKNILSHPLFKTTGDFTGMTQESAVLQKKSGYSSVYGSWILLRRSVQLLEGLHRIELKNIAELYQYWCFLKLIKLIQSLVGCEPEQADLQAIIKDNFLYTLKRGTSPGAVFSTATGDQIELYHEHPFRRIIHPSNLTGVFTEEQRPDITLRITKQDLRPAHAFTYLFDAKYRIDRDPNELDRPPIDAMNQVHRYRDAIYRFGDGSVREREVVGAYVLFPGQGSIKTIRSANYFLAIDAINIGAFPLKPGSNEGEKLLMDQLRKIISSSSADLLNEIIPHKGLKYANADGMILIVFPAVTKEPEYLQDDGTVVYLIPLVDNTGKTHEVEFFRRIEYLAPASDKISHFYRVDRMTIKLRSEITTLSAKPGRSTRKMAKEYYYVFYLSGRQEFRKPIEVKPGEDPDFLFGRLSKWQSIS